LPVHDDHHVVIIFSIFLFIAVAMLATIWIWGDNGWEIFTGPCLPSTSILIFAITGDPSGHGHQGSAA
jgi:hypothetical protein